MDIHYIHKILIVIHKVCSVKKIIKDKNNNLLVFKKLAIVLIIFILRKNDKITENKRLIIEMIFIYNIFHIFFIIQITNKN